MTRLLVWLGVIYSPEARHGHDAELARMADPRPSTLYDREEVS